MKIHTVGAELFYAGGQTDVTKLIVAFRSSTNASEHYFRMKFANNL